MSDELPTFRAALADLLSQPEMEIDDLLTKTTKVLKVASWAAEDSDDDGAAIYKEVVESFLELAASADPDSEALLTDIASFWGQVAASRATPEVVVEPQPFDTTVVQAETPPLLSADEPPSHKWERSSPSQLQQGFESKFYPRRSTRQKRSAAPAENPDSTNTPLPRRGRGRK